MSQVGNFGALRQREPRIRDKLYLGWVSQLPCIICAVQGRRTWPVEVAHVKVGFPEAGWRAFGHSEKSHDTRTAPICSVHHRTGSDAQHRNPWGDERAWWSYWGVYPPDFCGALRAAYEAGAPGAAVVERFARRATTEGAHRDTPTYGLEPRLIYRDVPSSADLARMRRNRS